MCTFLSIVFTSDLCTTCWVALIRQQCVMLIELLFYYHSCQSDITSS